MKENNTFNLPNHPIGHQTEHKFRKLILPALIGFIPLWLMMGLLHFFYANQSGIYELSQIRILFSVTLLTVIVFSLPTVLVIVGQIIGGAKVYLFSLVLVSFTTASLLFLAITGTWFFDRTLLAGSLFFVVYLAATLPVVCTLNRYF